MYIKQYMAMYTRDKEDMESINITNVNSETEQFTFSDGVKVKLIDNGDNRKLLKAKEGVFTNERLSQLAVESKSDIKGIVMSDTIFDEVTSNTFYSDGRIDINVISGNEDKLFIYGKEVDEEAVDYFKINPITGQYVFECELRKDEPNYIEFEHLPYIDIDGDIPDLIRFLYGRDIQ